MKGKTPFAPLRVAFHGGVRTRLEMDALQEDTPTFQTPPLSPPESMGSKVYKCNISTLA